MVVFLGSNSVLPKSYRNVVTKNLEILNASYVSAKLPTQFFAAPKLLNCCLKQFNKGNAFGKKENLKKE